jgi:hypothetical protein
MICVLEGDNDGDACADSYLRREDLVNDEWCRGRRGKGGHPRAKFVMVMMNAQAAVVTN